MAKSKHGEAVKEALEQQSAEAPDTEVNQEAADAFTLTEDELALANLFDDTKVDTPDTPSTTESKDEVVEEKAEEKVEEETSEPVEAAEQEEEASVSEEPDAEEDDAPVLDLVSETSEEETPAEQTETSKEDLEKQRVEWRENATKQLEDYYAKQLTEDDKDLLLTNPEQVLPKLLARSYLDMYDSLMTGVSQTMPGQMTQMMEAQKAATTAEKQFFDKWPALQSASKDPAKREVIQRAIQSYRQVNPGVALEQAIAEAGAMAMVTLKLPLGETIQASKKQKAEPFKPATPGGGSTTAPSAPPELNEFEQLANELLEDDD